jgi:hypothetical protein
LTKRGLRLAGPDRASPSDPIVGIEAFGGLDREKGLSFAKRADGTDVGVNDAPLGMNAWS